MAMSAPRAMSNRRLRHMLACTAATASTEPDEADDVPDYALRFKPLPADVEDMAELLRTDGFISHRR